YVGAPPMIRKVRSRAATTEGSVRSPRAKITRNRDHANQAQNNWALLPPDGRAVAVVPLQPQPRLGDPGLVSPVALPPPLRLELSNHPAGGAQGPPKAQGQQLVVPPIRSDAALRAVDPLGDLVRERVRHRSRGWVDVGSKP